MISVKDFKVDQTAYILNIKYNWRIEKTEARIKEAVVTKVGRKYVTIKRDKKFTPEYKYAKKDYIFEGLVSCDDGDSNLLFLSELEAEQYIKKFELCYSLHRKLELSGSWTQYSYSQLMRINEILNEDPDPGVSGSNE